MGFRSQLLTGLLASALSLSGGLALAQEGSPAASPVAQGESVTVEMTNQDGDPVGNATFSETADGVQITVESVTEGSGLEPGEHGIHIHETGACDPSGETAFQSAGGHFNPTDASHGGPDDEDSHAGDLGNLTVDENGAFELDITTDRVTLDPEAENSLADADGSALVIHAGEDDLETDPTGESGERLVCGVIFPAMEGTPEATPVG
jgi:Cu-Zn family superoxide dismutase